MLNAIQQGIITSSTKRRMDELEQRKEDIEISIAKEKIAKTPLTKEQIFFWISKFKDGDIDDFKYRQQIVDIFVNSVFLYDDELVITFNWKDGSKTVTLGELKAVEAACVGEFRCSHLDCGSPFARFTITNVFIVCFFFFPE